MSSTVQSDFVGGNPAHSPPRAATSRRPPGLWDDVEIDRELRRASQLIRQCETQTGCGQGGMETLGHSYVPAPGAGRTSDSGNSTGATTEAMTHRQPAIAPLASTNRPSHAALVPLIAGAVLLVVGLAFLAIAVVDQRPDWWQPGLPLAILGQASLSLGIVLKLEFLQRRSPPLG